MNLAINGFGRIGRTFLRTAMARELQVLAINDLTAPATLAHLFKYDSVHGVYQGTVSYGDDFLMIDGHKIKIYNCANPSQLPWAALAIDLVIESTGKFTSRANASLHLTAGAKQVLISAPAS
jgi:glyceraldehyde 3-phosphate dehydrogenase